MKDYAIFWTGELKHEFILFQNEYYRTIAKKDYDYPIGFEHKNRIHLINSGAVIQFKRLYKQIIVISYSE